MRRRRHLDVWPAVADLMTVLAVLGLFIALAVVPAAGEPTAELRETIRRKEQQIRDLRARLEASEARHAADRREWEGRLDEVVRNERMFQAIQRVQEIIDQISADRDLEFSDDQTLVFGDDLVEYEVNSAVPIFRANGRKRLHDFCSRLSDLGQKKATRQLFTVEVRGHTDDLQCPGDPHCNWWISSTRAAHFVALMQDDTLCPGGKQLRLRPVGAASSVPFEGASQRRIEIIITPNYHFLIAGKR